MTELPTAEQAMRSELAEFDLHVASDITEGSGGIVHSCYWVETMSDESVVLS